VRKIAILNQKGGVGKTTTVVNVSAALALRGHRVLVIDLDPQAHLTIHLGADKHTDAKGVYEVLTGGAAMQEAVLPVRDNLSLLGASIDLVGAETELINEVGREIILKKAVDSVEDQFDFVLMDCPPSLGLLTLNALAAVDEVVIPIQPHFLALQGFSRLLQTVTLVKTRINPALRVSAILMCMFDSRTSLSNEVREDVRQFLASARDSNHPWAQAEVIPVPIRPNIKLAEAPSHGQSIFEYEPQCNGAADYKAVAAFLSGETAETEAEIVNPSGQVQNSAEDQGAAAQEDKAAAMDTASTGTATEESHSAFSDEPETHKTADSFQQEHSSQSFGVQREY